MFKCLLLNGENTHVYDGTRFGVDLPLSDSIVVFHLFSRSEQHDAVTQILAPQYTSATLQVYYCRLWCELRVKKKKRKRGIAINYLFIQIVQTHNNNNKKRKEEKEKKHYHDINIVIREMIFSFFFFYLSRPSHFPGMNKVYCYCCFDSVSSRTDAF